MYLRVLLLGLPASMDTHSTRYLVITLALATRRSWVSVPKPMKKSCHEEAETGGCLWLIVQPAELSWWVGESLVPWRVLVSKKKKKSLILSMSVWPCFSATVQISPPGRRVAAIFCMHCSRQSLQARNPARKLIQWSGWKPLGKSNSKLKERDWVGTAIKPWQMISLSLCSPVWSSLVL